MNYNETLRVAVVTTFPPGKGSLNEYAFHFVNALRQKPEVGEVILLTDHLPPGERYATEGEGAPLRIEACWRFGAWHNALSIVKTVKAVNPDVVLFNIQFASFGQGKIAAALGLTAPMMVRAAGFPTMVLLHNIMETVDLYTAGFARNSLAASVIRLAGTLMTSMLLKSDLVALTIPRYVELLEHKYRADNVLLAPHGSFTSAPVPSFELPPGPPNVLTFGKFGTYKKVEVLIDAIKRLRQRDGDDPELVIAGTDSPNVPGYLDGVQARYGEMKGVRYTGYVPEEEVEGLFREAAVVVFPYTGTTGSSGVLNQAGSFGKAAVLPNIGDFAELVREEGYLGEFFDPDSSESLAEAIGRLLDDPGRRRRIAKQNYLAATSLPISDVVDWYLLHMGALIKKRQQQKLRILYQVKQSVRSLRRHLMSTGTDLLASSQRLSHFVRNLVSNAA